MGDFLAKLLRAWDRLWAEDPDAYGAEIDRLARALAELHTRIAASEKNVLAQSTRLDTEMRAVQSMKDGWVRAADADTNTLRDMIGDILGFQSEIDQIRAELVSHNHPIPWDEMPAHEHGGATPGEHGHHWAYSSTDNMDGRRRLIYKCDQCGQTEVHIAKEG